MRDDLDRFYDILNRLRTLPGQGHRLADCTGRMHWPSRGVYFFFETGEHRCDLPGAPRVVRVGTHAVSKGSRSSLWGRLRAHRGGRDGGGNHRGSIFRLHVGAAILALEGQCLPTWGVKSSATRDVRKGEAVHERRVSDHIGSMSALWLDVAGDPGPASARAFIERNAIALISNRLAPFDAPGEHWLGRRSPRQEISRSGLWNLNYVNEAYDPAFLHLMADLGRRQRQSTGQYSR